MRSLNKKIKSLFLLISFTAYMPISIAPSFAAIDAGTKPEISSAINGSVTDKDNQVDVNLKTGLGSGGVGLFDWKSFDVGSDVTVNWVFSANGQKAINRVLNSGKASEIYGKLTSSCTDSCGGDRKSAVILINPNGVTFGSGSVVNLNSLTVSTRDIQGLTELKNQILNGTKSAAELTTKYGKTAPIVFDKSIIDSNGNGVISLDGAKINVEGSTANNEPKTTAMSVALIGDKIDIKNSEIQTYENPGTNGNLNNGYSRSGVKLITADGVQLQYDAAWANISEAVNDENGEVVNAVKISRENETTPGGDYGISIDNSKIYSGSVLVENKYETGDINLNDTILWGRKLYNGSTGEIAVKSEGNVNIVNSRLETMNLVKNKPNDANNPLKTNNYGGIEVSAKKNIKIDNSRIVSAPSDLNNGLANGVPGKSANILIKSEEGNITIQKSQEALEAGYKRGGGDVDIIAYGDLKLKADNGLIKTDLDKNTQLIAKRNLHIGGKNIELNGGVYASQQGNAMITTGTLVENANGLMDIYGGGIIINDAAIQASRGELGIQGLETTIANTALDYKTLALYNDYYTENQLNHDVLIKDDTTFYDRDVENGLKDTLVIETTGQLILDHNKLQKADFDNTRTDKDAWVSAPANQTANVKLSSTQSQVSIRNNSDVTVEKNIELNGKTNANVSASNVTSTNGNIKMVGGTKVTVGNAIDVIKDKDENFVYPNDKDIVKRGSNLTASNGNITLTSEGNVKDPTAKKDVRGVSVLHSNLTSKNNTLTAKRQGDVSIQTSNVTATNDNTLTAENGRVGIQNHIEKDGTVCGSSNVTAANLSNINASDDVIITKSTVRAGNNNTIASTNGKVYAQGTGALIKSNSADVIINQSKTANTDIDFDQSGVVQAAGSVYLNVTGDGEDINSNGTVNSFTKGANGRLVLNANNDINIIKQNGYDLNVTKTDLIAGNNITVKSNDKAVNLTDTSFNAKNNNVTAKGDVNINGNMTINNGKTTIKSNGNVKTNATNGTIVTNGNKLIVNADKNINIAFTGVNNKNAGLEINSDVNTSTNGVSASGRKESLAGRNVKLNAKDKDLAIAKIKADELTFVNPETNLIAALDGNINANTDNIGPSVDADTAKVGTAYIEVSKLAGWSMDKNVDDYENVPGFYKDSYDLASDNRTQRHWVQFGEGNDMLLVYQRATSEPCDPDPIPGDVGGTSYNIGNNGLKESAVVRLPRHAEGVSAVAPVLNEITDPTANVIMAAARITLDEENETDEEGDAIQ